MSGSEFDIIREVFAPLTKDAPGAFDLADDAALLESSGYIVTKDLMVAGVHFLPKDPLDLVARKILRVNLSDLAAKGAKPIGYFLGCVWSAGIEREEVERFAAGLAEDQVLFKIALYGGDTCVHKTKTGPLTLSVTCFGAPPRSGLTPRAGAKVGDEVYVSGTIGDAGLGLKALKRGAKFPPADKAPLIHRYQLPIPRLTLGGALANVASAAIDVSDGLIADAGHIAHASGLRIEIDANAIPLSAPARRWLGGETNEDAGRAALASFGDDYEILFTAAPELRRSVSVAADASRTEVTKIGVVKRGEGVALLDANSDEIPAASSGFDHFRS